MVADLLQNETVTSVLVSKRKEKGGEDSGLESGHTSMNTASDTQSDSHSASGSAAGDSLRPDSRSIAFTLTTFCFGQLDIHNRYLSNI